MGYDVTVWLRWVLRGRISYVSICRLRILPQLALSQSHAQGFKVRPNILQRYQHLGHHACYLCGYIDLGAFRAFKFLHS
jgi:hypothetical protein